MMTRREKDLRNLLLKVKEESAKTSLLLNIKRKAILCEHIKATEYK